MGMSIIISICINLIKLRVLSTPIFEFLVAAILSSIIALPILIFNMNVPDGRDFLTWNIIISSIFLLLAVIFVRSTLLFILFQSIASSFIAISLLLIYSIFLNR